MVCSFLESLLASGRSSHLVIPGATCFVPMTGQLRCFAKVVENLVTCTTHTLVSGTSSLVYALLSSECLLTPLPSPWNPIHVKGTLPSSRKPSMVCLPSFCCCVISLPLCQQMAPSKPLLRHFVPLTLSCSHPGHSPFGCDGSDGLWLFTEPPIVPAMGFAQAQAQWVQRIH